MAGDESDPRQLTAALLVVVDHLADRIIERVMELLPSRLAAQERSGAGREARGQPEKTAERARQQPHALQVGLMTLREVREYLSGGDGRGPSLETIRFWVHRLRLIPKVRLGGGRGHCYVRKADVDELVERGRQSGGHRVNLREQARELLDAADRRAEVRNQRRVERREAPRRATAKVIKFATPAPPEGSA